MTKFFLETERLIVKPPCLENFPEVSALFACPDAMRYVGRGTRTADESREAMQRMVQHYEKHGFSLGDAYEKATGAYVGRAGLVYLEMNDTQPEIEIGYVLNKAFWGKGYATELAKAIVDWGFKHLSVNQLLGVIRPANQASRHVLEKTGMQYLRTETRYGGDCEIYRILLDL